jgi:hypothetical protein
MNFDRRRFLGVMAGAAGALAAPRVFATPLCGEAPALLPQAMAALDRHSRLIPHRDLIGVVNFAAHSRLERLQIVDVAAGRTVASMLVAHGNGSDPGNSGWVQRFSNRPGSNASCPGAFLTGTTYTGKHGRSRKLIGLDPENCLAEPRAIVIHGADYVSQAMAQNQGRVGRSQGCFAVSRADIGELLDKLGQGRLLFAAKA